MTYASLYHKVAVITGASKGIGRAVAERMADEQMHLVLNSRTEAPLQAAVEMCMARHAETVSLCADVSDAHTAGQLCKLALERFGRLDVVVNCAGIVIESPLGLIDDDEVARLVATNILGATWMTRAALKPMMKQRSGVIINFSSALASRPGRGNAVYAGTKGYIESFTRAMAAELGRKNIRINALSPGVIETAMTRPVMNLAGAAILARIGLNRVGTAQEVASVAAFLASDEASYIHGAVVAVDGAFSGPA
jgi:3-oxoacyl-[acyl-carrier protein] reductase